MDISFSNGNTYISRDGLFEPSKTFDCGQCFRFERCEGGWQGIAMGRLLMAIDLVVIIATAAVFRSLESGLYGLVALGA